MTTTRTIADRDPGGSAAGPERAPDGEARSTRARAPHPNARPGRGEGTGKKLLALPVWLLVIVCSGLPLAWMVGQIAFNSAVLTEARLDGHRWQLLARTLLYNGAAGVVSTLISLPAAIVLGRGRGFFAKVLWFVLPATLLLPSITYAYGWSQLLRMIADRNEDLRIAPASVTDVARCVLTLGAWLWPLPAAAIGLALRRLDAQVQQQSLLDGVLWRMTFRQLLAPAAAGAAIVAVLAMQEFAIYEPTGISVVATEVRMVFETGAFSSADNPITAPMGGGGSPEDSGGLAAQRARAAAAVATALPLLGVIGVLS